MTESTARRDEPVTAMVAANTAGPKMPANLSATPKKAKNSPERWRGTSEANKERESACVPPCTMATKTARTKKWVSVRVK